VPPRQPVDDLGSWTVADGIVIYADILPLPSGLVSL